MIRRSARACTVAGDESTLSELSGSRASLSTDALLTMIAPSGVSGFTLTTTVIVRVTPFDIVPRSHVSTAAPAQVPKLGVALTMLTSIGRTSVTTTPGAADGPLL